jgi:SAM-dependent methyltransferase
MPDLQRTYAARFSATGLERRKRVWRVLCREVFDKLSSPQDTVVDLACGYGEFINAVTAGRKIAVDLNPDSPRHLDPSVEFHARPALELGRIGTNIADLLFTSNFLEHLRDKSECDALFEQVLQVLKPGGRFVVLGPNIRYAYREYWDYYDHYLPLSHLSLAEGLGQAGFELERVIPRFLPYTMNSRMPTADVLVWAYLKLPLAWRVLGKQFLVVARKPRSP